MKVRVLVFIFAIILIGFVSSACVNFNEDKIKYVFDANNLKNKSAAGDVNNKVVGGITSPLNSTTTKTTNLLPTTIVITTIAAEKIAGESNEVTLLYFWSAYCGWCKKEDPIVNEFLKKHPSLKLIIVDVNKPENRDIMTKYQAFGTPTFVLFINEENKTTLKAPGFLNEKNFEKFVCMKLKDEECRKIKG